MFFTASWCKLSVCVFVFGSGKQMQCWTRLLRRCCFFPTLLGLSDCDETLHMWDSPAAAAADEFRPHAANGLTELLFFFFKEC